MISQIPVRSHIRTRLNPVLLASAILFIAWAPFVCAQEDGDTPLGDVARTFRKKPAAPEAVIDNDNFSKVVDDAESRRATGSSPVFSLEPGGKSFHVSSPDVTCSLSFSGKTTSLLSDPLLLDELPHSELAKLDGPATLDGDSLQVSMHNGTSWELREVVIGLTIVKRTDPGDTASGFGQARIIPAVAASTQQGSDPYQKQPDVTLLLRVKGSAAPSATAIFRTSLNFALFPDQEWHWAIVKAKGIPPPPVPETSTIQSEQSLDHLPLPPYETGANSPSLSPTASSPSNPDVATH